MFSSLRRDFSVGTSRSEKYIRAAVWPGHLCDVTGVLVETFASHKYIQQK